MGASAKGKNYVTLYNDATALHSLAVRWSVTNHGQYAEARATITDALSRTRTIVGGLSDTFLAFEIYWYQIANVVAIVRGSRAWVGFAGAKEILVHIFYRMSHQDLVNHNDAAVDHCWENCDPSNFNNLAAIGAVTNYKTMFNGAIKNFYNGDANAPITNNLGKMHLHIGGQDLGQPEQLGRAQGYTKFDVCMLAMIAPMGSNRGIDPFFYLDSPILKVSEYAANTKLGYDVPYTTYVNSRVTETVICSNSLGGVSPI
ncbi:hypothetical protein HOY80DRAFT_1102862 [Tuber brumale]|nr:hypothetical protein HOY80DRAFT_1102862 [Tuber brumale]